MNIYLSSSWKNRDRVRALATLLRGNGHEVYDFTDSDCRPDAPELPPEKFPENFDTKKHVYREYMQAFPEWEAGVLCNKNALKKCDVIVLMLPCGNDAHADAFFGFGLGKYLIVCGQPRDGERTPTHLWAQAFVDKDEDVIEHLKDRSLLPRTGDVVLHMPSQETWLVAYTEDDGKKLAPCGWPFALADVADCVVKERASDKQSAKLLKKLSEMSSAAASGEVHSDFRRIYARRKLGLTG